jgi:hypothetical protein
VNIRDQEQGARQKTYQLLDLVPFEYAAYRWRELPLTERYDRDKPTRGDPGPNRCKTCGAMIGSMGFIRMCYPVGHELFGRAICCPECWPSPFGRNQRMRLEMLKENTRDLAKQWMPILEGIREMAR